MKAALSSPAPAPPVPHAARFRVRLLLAMMLVIAAIAGLALYFAQRDLVASFEAELERDFEAQVLGLQHAREVRQAALLERSRALVRRSRIVAALEDGALDLLYPNAHDELRDLVARAPGARREGLARGLQAEFYRFLDRDGAVISPAGTPGVGALAPEEEARLSLPGIPGMHQLGYLPRLRAGGLAEVFAMPILSMESGEPIAALVLGFEWFALDGGRSDTLQSGIWLEGRLYSSTLAEPVAAAVARELGPRGKAGTRREGSRRTRIEAGGIPQLLFCQPINPGSAFPTAFEVRVYPLDALLGRQQELRWRVLGAGGVLLLLGLGGSHLVSARMSAPVEKLAVESEEERRQRARAEATLEMRNAELQRSARFSADASHQLKTPVTVLRAGLEELLAHENLSPAQSEQVAALVHQTYRLSSLIEDLLLLSRMDAGRLRLQLGPVDLRRLIEASLDDLSAVPDELELRVETDLPPSLRVLGEQRYTAIILQNLLENARKYNRPGGSIRLVAQSDGGQVCLRIANTGRVIPPAAQAQVFERFHRAAMAENVPGYGLGLNLARELARLHGGDLRLVRSDADGTEFAVTFRFATAGGAAA